MSSDDLTRQLAHLLMAGPTLRDDRLGWLSVEERAEDRARAILASGLVVPTSAVLNRARQWERMGPALTDGVSVAAELRALTRQETP